MTKHKWKGCIHIFQFFRITWSGKFKFTLTLEVSQNQTGSCFWMHFVQNELDWFLVNWKVWVHPKCGLLSN